MVYKFLDWYTSFRVQVLHLAVLWISSKWSSQYCILKIFLPNFFLPIHTPSIITASSTLKKKWSWDFSILTFVHKVKTNGNSFNICIYIYIYTVWLFYSFYQKLKKGKGTFPFHNETRGQQALKVTWVDIAHTMNCQILKSPHYFWELRTIRNKDKSSAFAIYIIACCYKTAGSISLDQSINLLYSHAPHNWTNDYPYFVRICSAKIKM